MYSFYKISKQYILYKVPNFSFYSLLFFSLIVFRIIDSFFIIKNLIATSLIKFSTRKICLLRYSLNYSYQTVNIFWHLFWFLNNYFLKILPKFELGRNTGESLYYISPSHSRGLLNIRQKIKISYSQFSI